GWGYTESVLVNGENVYCTPGGKKGAIAALDTATGEVKWQSTEFTDGAQYASMASSEINGTRQVIQLTMNSLVGIDSKNGKLLWKSEFPGRTAVIPSPVVQGNEVYITAGYGAGCKLVRIGAKNKVEEVYENKVMKNHHGGVVLVGGHIYGYSDGPGWVCQKFTSGEEVWASKKLGKGAVTSAGGRLYCLEEDSGTVVLIEPSTTGWKEHGRFKLQAQSSQRSSSGKVWTHPVIANGKLYLRDQELLSCYDVSGQ
ncbi:MAG TPA: PQQ-binding-like beta-propeller repeat protein, partial [Verrucomicrobiae bacterium]|nr:PQQ-binding-like beta-propeller repeat protein [Verrucomicrobiae bacterium]